MEEKVERFEQKELQNVTQKAAFGKTPGKASASAPMATAL